VDWFRAAVVVVVLAATVMAVEPSLVERTLVVVVPLGFPLPGLLFERQAGTQGELPIGTVKGGKERPYVLVVGHEFEQAISQIADARMGFGGESKHDRLILVSGVATRIIEDANGDEAIVGFINVGGSFVRGLMDHGWFSFFV
jgi:hypothetical protein